MRTHASPPAELTKHRSGASASLHPSTSAQYGRRRQKLAHGGPTSVGLAPSVVASVPTSAGVGPNLVAESNSTEAAPILAKLSRESPCKCVGRARATRCRVRPNVWHRFGQTWGDVDKAGPNSDKEVKSEGVWPESEELGGSNGGRARSSACGRLVAAFAAVRARGALGGRRRGREAAATVAIVGGGGPAAEVPARVILLKPHRPRTGVANCGRLRPKADQARQDQSWTEVDRQTLGRCYFWAEAD